MATKTDSWCKPVLSRHGRVVSGGAARAVRIADLGGMDEIVERVAHDTLAAANAIAVKRGRAKLRLVSNG